ncbi:MAG: hypothetical protein WB762_00500 [Candidatus Sulfotelmatobacter sp.]
MTLYLENLALRQQLSIYQRQQKRPRLSGGDSWFWMTVSVMWKNWRQALHMAHPDPVVRGPRERFRGIGEGCPGNREELGGRRSSARFTG